MKTTNFDKFEEEIIKQISKITNISRKKLLKQSPKKLMKSKLTPGIIK